MNSISLHEESEGSSCLDDEIDEYMPSHFSNVSQSLHDSWQNVDLEQSNPLSVDDGLIGHVSPISNALLALAEEEDISVWLSQDASEDIISKEKQEIDITDMISSESSENSNRVKKDKSPDVKSMLSTPLDAPLKATESLKQSPESPIDDLLLSNAPESRAINTTRKKISLCVGCWIVSVILVILITVLTLQFRHVAKANVQGESSFTKSKATNAPSASFLTYSSSYPTKFPSVYPTSETLSPSQKITNSPISMAESIDIIREWILEQNYSSPKRFQDDDSPHSQALKFMAEDEITGIPSDEFSDSDKTDWLQRYVVTLFYYSLSGDNWIQKLNFLNHTLPTCSWYQTFSLPNEATVSFGVLCPGKDNLVKEIRIGT
jgi:hypothetical protein